MELNKVKAGDKVKFNGQTWDEGDCSELSTRYGYWWMDEMTDYVNANKDVVHEVVFVHDNSCVELKKDKRSISYSWTPACFELVVEPAVEQTPNPYGFTEHQLELLKALTEGKRLQYKHWDSWYDSTGPLSAIGSSKTIPVRIKPPEPVVTYGFQGVEACGYIADNKMESVEKLLKSYDLKSTHFKHYLKKTFHDGLFVKMEVIDNPAYKE